MQAMAADQRKEGREKRAPRRACPACDQGSKLADLQAEERGCVCPPELPACVCGRSPRLRILTRPPITAGEAELAANPRSRSAKLRVAERL